MLSSIQEGGVILDIKGLDYVVFAFIRDLVKKERHQKWVEFSAPLTLDKGHRGKMRDVLFADLELGSVFGMYNVILARIAEAESQLQAILPGCGTSTPMLLVDPRVDKELREEARIEVCGSARNYYESTVVSLVMDLVYERLGIAVDGDRIPPRQIRSEFCNGGNPYDAEVESEGNDDS